MTAEHRGRAPEGLRLLTTKRGAIPSFPYMAIDLNQNRPPLTTVREKLQEHILGGQENTGTMKFVVSEGDNGPVLFIGPREVVDTHDENKTVYPVTHRDLADTRYEFLNDDEVSPLLLAAGLVEIDKVGSLNFTGGSDTLGNRLSFEASAKYITEALTPRFRSNE